MLFNSYQFIFLFCPIVFFGFFLIGKHSLLFGRLWLTAASFVFYAWWDVASLLLICVSMLVNFSIGRPLMRQTGYSPGPRLRLLILGVAFNLGLLVYYKYSYFFINQWYAFRGLPSHTSPPNLPLGISFFTFVQIAFLVDAYRNEKMSYGWVDYGLFVTYFPHLIAGPIIHHADVIPKFHETPTFRFRSSNASIAISLFAIGLFKKTVIADHIAVFVPPIFDHPQNITSTLFESWAGVLAYTLQIYFDFSGYSDMALGLSRMFGVALPANFFSPYKSNNIIEFWRRWHMSLSRFLRDYLYIPLGGNRRGNVRRYINLFVTMVLGGFWHGAGWTFVIWGALHGLFLVINHLWNDRKKLVNINPDNRCGWFFVVAARSSTFLAVMFAWIFFRAPSVEIALQIVRSMLGYNGVSVSKAVMRKIPELSSYGFQADGFFPTLVGLRGPGIFLLIGLLAFVHLAPNCLELTQKYEPCSGTEHFSQSKLRAGWHPSVSWATLIAFLFIIGVIHINKASIFLYFQF